jgi:hypothetical protein
MTDFSKLKSSRGSNLAALTEKLDAMNKGASRQKDERLFKPGFDAKEGKGYAVVRFLPNPHGESFVRVYTHGFSVGNNWYFESSRTTIGEDDPVGISNKLHWERAEATGNESLKNIAKSRKRNTKYYANVFVVKDTINPENNGKVMIYEFGPQIFKMIESSAKPEFEDDKPCDPFDMWSGADFKIKIVGKEMPGRDGKKVIVPNYENSEFDSPSEFKSTDEEREEIFNKTFDLAPFAKVKSFDELAERFKKVTGQAYDALQNNSPEELAAVKVDKQIDNANSQAPAAAGRTAEPAQSAAVEDDEDDDIMSQFKALANQV